MKSVNWSNVEKTAKMIKRNYKNIEYAADYLKNVPEDGYMRDNKTLENVSIVDCKDSTLRRYLRLLTSYYYLVDTKSHKDTILKKKIEIENEIDKRERVNG